MLQTAFIIALSVYFLHATCWEGNINEWVQRLTFNWPDNIKRPLYACCTCMAPYYGSLILIGMGLKTGHWLHWFDWVITLATAAAIATIISYLVDAAKTITNHLEVKE